MGVALPSPVHSDAYSVTVGRACLARAIHPLSETGGGFGAANRGPTNHQFANQPGNVGASRRSQVAVVAEHVLVTTDGSAQASRAVPLALAAVRACSSQRVTLLRVLTNGGELGSNPVQALEWELGRAHARADLRRAAEEFGELAGDLEQVVAEGRAAEQILRFVDSGNVDLVVMAAHGSDDSRNWRLGSVAAKVVASGRASVLVVPTETESTRINRVLLPLDCSARAECVVPLVAKLADVHDAEFVLLHVVARPELPHRMPAGARERELVDELTRSSCRRAEAYLHNVRERLVSRGAKVEIKLIVDSHPARAIEQVAVSSGVDLILVSAHGSSGDEREAYGSLPRRLLDTMVKPLWIVQDLPQARTQAQPRDERSGGGSL